MLLKNTSLGITNLQSLQPLYPTPASSKQKSKLPDILISCKGGVKHPTTTQVQAGVAGQVGEEHHQGEHGGGHGLPVIDQLRRLFNAQQNVQVYG
jgi:hypothetical protein